MCKTFRYVPLLLIILGLVLSFYFNLFEYFTFARLQEYNQLLFEFVENKYPFAIITFMVVYVLIVILSIPVASFLTIAAGFLFGTVVASTIVVLCATIGACLLFLAVRLAFADYLRTKFTSWQSKLSAELNTNGFNYLLFIRLVPLFPFWVVNIVPALLNMRFATYLSATFLGVIPGTIVYAAIGNGLTAVFEENAAELVLSSKVIVPFVALAILALVPVIYRRYKK